MSPCERTYLVRNVVQVFICFQSTPWLDGKHGKRLWLHVRSVGCLGFVQIVCVHCA